MAEVRLEDAPPKARDLFNKGFGAFERGNLDYAIDLLFSCLAICPELLQARKFLRAAEVQRFKNKKGGALTHIVSTVTGLPTYLGALTLVKSGKALQAVTTAEKLLRIDPLNVRFMKVLAQATAQADLPEAAVQVMELARDHYPNDNSVLHMLGALYQKTERTRDAREVFEQLAELAPNDPLARKALKDATALETMSKDGWSEAADSGATFREILKDEDEAQRLEQQAKFKKTEHDVDSLIADSKEKLEAEPENINFYRALGRLYVQKKMFDEALDIIGQALEISGGDPELDASVTRIRTQKMEHEVAELREAGDETAAAELEAKRNEFVFENLRDRVVRYPNDLGLRFEWGVAQYDLGETNEAIQQFQLSQRSPTHRVRSLYYLAMCFKAKEQYDMGSEQLEQALQLLPQMDDTKKDICYELGEIAELTGDWDKAADYYKQIYQVDIGYRDIADKVEGAYRQKKGGEASP